MRDPFPIPPPPALVKAITPLADVLSLDSLPLHAHEVIFAFSLYTFVFLVVSPAISRLVVPERYKAFSPRTRIGWDVHIVSFVQSVIICALSLYVIFVDEERKSWRPWGEWESRLWGYSGMSGMCQSFALGYFLWDLWMCTYHLNIFGWGMLAHAISAVTVFALGYRPFVYFYCPVFLLYELSSPFLNIHWFCDKLSMTGSTVQAINGAFLTVTFFLCRICWGTYSSFRVATDVYRAIQAGQSEPLSAAAAHQIRRIDPSLYYASDAKQRAAFISSSHLPLWMAGAYVASNLTLNMLNVYWFGKMIETIRSRFNPPFGTKGTVPSRVPKDPKDHVPTDLSSAVDAMNGAAEDDNIKVSRSLDADGMTTVEVSGTQRKSARSRKA
ncbi:putative tlc domain-containing protein c17a2.02c [Acrodontium crateriforme]|uniref:Tlc domain-containing protein c17a2.02c n=1 Tax=Acrodontium crateriforme TaxID=150365 RepID=A0AAQ3M3Y8_9PEZI|nr:putative tlc domain-containing protein c17a2.02c [Acrodontium crateriforme]